MFVEKEVAWSVSYRLIRESASIETGSSDLVFTVTVLIRYARFLHAWLYGQLRELLEVHARAV